MKAPFPKVVTLSGIDTASSIFPWKALSSIVFSPSLKSIAVRLLYSNAFAPINATFFGKETLSIPFGDSTLNFIIVTSSSGILNADAPMAMISSPVGVLSGRTRE